MLVWESLYTLPVLRGQGRVMVLETGGIPDAVQQEVGGKV